MKTVRTVSLLLVASILIWTAACAVQKEKKEDTAVTYILDTQFEDGVSVMHPSRALVRLSGKLDFGKKTDNPPAWLMTQWQSKYDLAEEKGKKTEGGYVYENEGKQVSVIKEGDGSEVLSLRVKGGNEYDRPRTSDVPWIHLYMEQRYDAPKSIAALAQWNLKCDISIPQCKNLMTPEEYDPGLHAAIAVFYLIVGDINPESKGYGDFMNFCIPLHDNRHEVPPGEWHMDSGFSELGDTHKIIYTVEGKQIFNAPTGNGQWHSIDMDVMPEIKKAFTLAKSKDCFVNTEFKDLGLTAVYIGWEVPGTFDCEMKIKNISLKGLGESHE